jgi:glycosyltransferase involved in cell wall biosynthesis
MLSRQDLQPSEQRAGSPTAPRVLIAAEHASAKFGGEAALPLHYFRVLRQRGADVWLLVHSRTRDELMALYPGDDRIVFVEDTASDRLLWRLSTFLPDRLSYFSTGFIMRCRTQWVQRRLARRLIAENGIQIVHQPIPVSPREPSGVFGLGVPVVIGPMNGGMSFPDAFRGYDSATVRALVAAGRACSRLVNRLIPGKRLAAALLVANRRTRDALPVARPRRVVELVENGVDLSLWTGRGQPRAVVEGSTAQFVFIGRLVDWKAVDLLLDAFSAAAAKAPMSLRIVGDGPERPKLEEFCRERRLLGEVGQAGKVAFSGWRSQAECAAILVDSDALVLPSLLECGGAVVLEAMACGRPAIATKWGGPEDYIDPSCGILVPPTSREAFLFGFEEALVSLARSPELRQRLGAAAAAKARRDFDWEVKVDRMIEVYWQAIEEHGTTRRALAGQIGR